MRHFISAVLLISLVVTGALAEDNLTREEQEQIVNDYLNAIDHHGKERTDQLTLSTEDEPPLKCGTPSIARFQANRDKLDDDLLQSLSVIEAPRPDLPLSYISPSGHFKIHYAITGVDSVYRASVDNNSNGIPDYIDTIAIVADSVWEIEINQLGFPTPIVDTICATGDGPQFDIYVSALSHGIFGQTWADLDCAVEGTFLMQVPAFLELDNDYQHISYYKDRPLDAARVTIAHEFFHAIQFAMDWTEVTGLSNAYWLEMSCVWMEEHVYDNINDYYHYLPYFFNDPRVSFQQFLDGGDLHPYASVVYPLYLTQTYGDDIIRLIWQKEAELGVGPNFLQAAAFYIDSLSGGTENYVTAFNEYSLWNFFTGFRSTFAPNGLGYEEGSAYPVFPDTVFIGLQQLPVEIVGVYDSFPIQLVTASANKFKPQHNAASILRFENTQLVKEDRYYRCVDSLTFYSPLCQQDSTIPVEVNDTATEVWDVIDSSFTITTALESMALVFGSDTAKTDWSVSLIFQDLFDSIQIDRLYIPSFNCTQYTCLTSGANLEIDNVNQYKRITMILAPASPYEELFNGGKDKLYAYAVRELMSGDTVVPVEEGYTVNQTPLIIYPNPAVVNQMTEPFVTLKVGQIQVEGDPFIGLPSVRVRTMVNIFDIAGNIVYSVDTTVSRELMEFFGEGDRPLEVAWNMNNQAGKPVASGVYFGIAEIYINRQKVAEGTGKVAIIR